MAKCEIEDKVHENLTSKWALSKTDGKVRIYENLTSKWAQKAEIEERYAIVFWTIDY